MGFLDIFREKSRYLKDIEKVKISIKKEKQKDKFFEKLQKLSFIQDNKKRKDEINELVSLSKKIPEFSDWSRNNKKFWDIEANFWSTRIPKSTRIFIKNYLKKIVKNNSIHLSVGSGSCPYLDNAICIDFSKEMLDNIRMKTKQRIVCNLDNEKIPLKSNSVDFISMVFILNYLKNPEDVLLECKRVLKKGGKLIIINSKNKVSGLYRRFEIKNFDEKNLELILSKTKLKYKIENHKTNDELIFAIANK